jgi:basic amino acid/polyamine antiporter, APA family
MHPIRVVSDLFFKKRKPPYRGFKKKSLNHQSLNHAMSTQESQFKQSLTLTDATMLVMGSMIGSGVFIVSADILQNVGSVGLLMVVWLLSGLLTLTAAVSYGELAGMYPKAGGQYVYLREAFGPMVAFLYGWAFFAVIQTGTIAAVGVGFAKFTAYLVPSLGETNYLLDWGSFRISAGQLVAIVLICLLTWINSRGIQNGRWIQLVFTFTKIAALALLLILGFSVGFDGDIWAKNWGAGAWDFGTWNKDSLAYAAGSGSVLVAIAVASVGSLFSMDAWNNVTFVAGEIRRPERNIGLSLLLGTLAVTVIFLLCNLMYTATLSAEGIAFAKDGRVGIAAGRAFLGDTGVLAIAVMLMVSTFGCNNGIILSGARVYYSMAKDGLFFRSAARLNEQGVPAYALWAQCLWACLLCLTGRYGDLLDYVVFAVLIFYVLTIAGIFVLRRRQPDLARPYRAFGYPILPALYIVVASAICVILLVYKPWYSWPGLGLVLLGVPLYFWLLAKKEGER